MEANGISLFAGGTLHLDGLLHSTREEEEEDVDEEEERKWNLDLQKAVQDAFDDLDETSQEHLALYSADQSGDESPTQAGDGADTESVQCTEDSRERTAAGHQGLPSECENGLRATGGRHSPSVWSDKSDEDGSGNFVTTEALVGSPTQFRLDLSRVVSRSDDSVSEPGLSHASYGEPAPVVATFSTDQKNPGGSDEGFTQTDFLSALTSDEQIKLLYEARGRELDRLSEKLNQERLSSQQEVSSMKRQLTVAKADRETLLAGENQMKLLLAESEARIRGLTSDVRERDERLDAMETENKKLKLRLSTAEGTISSLEVQVAELQSIDCIAKSRQAHEDFLKKLQGSHREEVEELKRKLKSATSRVEELEHEVTSLEENLATVRKSKDLALQEKAEVIRQLNSSLDTAHQHMEALLRQKTEKMDSSGKCECNGRAKRELETYDMLAKLGLFKSVLSSSETSADQLRLGKVLTFDESSVVPPLAESLPEANRECVPDSNINERLKREVFQCLLTNKLYREQIQQLTEGISRKENIIKSLEDEGKALKEALKQRRDSFANGKKLLITEENSRLKRELALLLGDFEAVRKRGEAMVEAFREEALQGNRRPVFGQIAIADAKIEAFQQYATALEKCGKVCTQTWEELRQENLELHSKRYSVVSSFESLIECLKEFRNEVKLKAFPDSSDTGRLKQLLDRFILNAKEVRKEASQYLQDSSRLKNDVWTLKLKVEKTTAENTALKATTEALQGKATESEREKLETVEKCKEMYLGFHEEAVLKLREDLQNEYNGIVTTLKEELERMADKVAEAQSNYVKVCHEKDELEDAYKDMADRGGNGARKGEEFSNDNLVKENDNLRKALDRFKLKSAELEHELELNNRQRSRSITENVELIEAKRQLAHLNDEVKRMEAEAIEMERNCAQQKNIFLKELEKVRSEGVRAGDGEGKTEAEGKESAEFSLSQILETVEEYKKLSNDLREEKDKLKSYYEKQVQDLKKKIEFHTKDVIAQTRRDLEGKFEEESALLKERVTRLSVMASRLEQEKAKLQESHTQEMRKLSDEIQNRESKIEQIKESYERSLNELMTSFHEANVENSRSREQIRSLKRTLDQHNEKYSHLKKKFFKVKNNFDKYREWADERANQLVAEATRQLQEKSEKWDWEIDGIKKWLSKCRSSLTDSISLVVKELESVPERAVPQASLEPQIKALLSIRKWILNLDLRDKNAQPALSQTGVEALEFNCSKTE